MNILFLGYWNLSDPLTEATIFPNLKILQDFSEIKKIVFVNTERAESAPKLKHEFGLDSIIYAPIFSSNLKWGVVNKIDDFIRFPKELTRLVRLHSIDLIIARGAPAGALACIVQQRTGTPFIVESFEPHADYMYESGVWSKYGLKYFFQKRWEERQKKLALGLMPVAENYKRKLIDEGVAEEKIKTVPCTVNFNNFFYDSDKRERMRKKLAIDKNAIVGIYAGKFGGLYLVDEAFDLYSAAFQCFPSFHLVLLTPVEFHGWVLQQIGSRGIPLERVILRQVSHDQVPHYLCLSDFAFATYKPGLSKSYLSPVKIGEYWACGLPIVLTQGVGDESDYIEKEGGVLFGLKDLNLSSLKNIFNKLNDLLRRSGQREKLSQLAMEHRNEEKTKRAYIYFLNIACRNPV